MAELAAVAAPTLIGPRAQPGTVDRIVAAMSEVPARTFRNVVQLLITFDLRHNLGNIAVPTLLVAGEHDRQAPARMMEKTAKYIPGARFEVMPGIGHMIQMEDPDWVQQSRR